MFRSDAECRQLKAALGLQIERFETQSAELQNLEKRITMLGNEKRMATLVIEKSLPSVHIPEDLPAKEVGTKKHSFLPIYD